MNNNAFKDLVRARIGSTSSKAIARKAVEEEFRKKKRRRPGGGGDLSSSDEEDDYESSHKKKGKRQQEDENEEKDGDDAEAIQKDLSARYRDRAKERREGKLAATCTSTDETAAAAADDPGASNSLLIVPHNIKGLDLALVRKERLELQAKSGGGNRKSTTATINTTVTEKEGKESTSKIKSIDEPRVKMPTSLDQATQILQDFLATENGKNINDSYNEDDTLPVILSNGLVEYLSEIVSWKTLDISTWEGGPTDSKVAASKSLQHTKFALAIDGNPSDPTRAWEIPRQYTQGGGSGGAASSSGLLPTNVMNKINTVFRKQNSIREEMMERQTSKARWTRIDLKKDTPPPAGKENDNDLNAGADDDESDDDMFGGLDD